VDPLTSGDLVLLVNGNRLTGNPVPFIIEDSVDVVLEAYKGPKGRVYENVRVYMVSSCEWEIYNDVETGAPNFIHDWVDISMSFLPDCPIASWHPSFLPLPPATSEERTVRLAVQFPDYEIEQNVLTKVEFLYLREGDHYWHSIAELEQDFLELETFSSFYDWTVGQNIYDGSYEVKVKAACELSSSESISVPLVIDQKIFKFFGTLSPLGNPLRKGEAAVLSFSKELDCPTLEISVTPEDNVKEALDFRTNCLDNLVKVLLSEDAHNSLRGKNAQLNLTVGSFTGPKISESILIDTGFSFLSFFLSFFLFFF